MTQKEFKTYIEQIDILRSRGMSISKEQESSVAKILEFENYYSVINGYKAPFIKISNPETYLPNTTFNEIYSLFVFDRNIRLIYLKFILKIEHFIKTSLAYEFSKLYGNAAYLNATNFDISTQDKAREVNKLINKINEETSHAIGKSNEITHYNRQYGFVPLWVLSNILTLGEVSHFYQCLKPRDMHIVSRHFNINPYDLIVYLKNLTLARNLCAHDERFYDYKFKSSISARSINNFNILNIPSNGSGFYFYGTKDIFSVAVVFARLLEKNDVNEFVALIDNEFKALAKSLKVINIDKIKRTMGFGTNWKLLTNLN